METWITLELSIKIILKDDFVHDVLPKYHWKYLESVTLLVGIN